MKTSAMGLWTHQHSDVTAQWGGGGYSKIRNREIMSHPTTENDKKINKAPLKAAEQGNPIGSFGKLQGERAS